MDLRGEDGLQELTMKGIQFISLRLRRVENDCAASLIKFLRRECEKRRQRDNCRTTRADAGA